MVQSLTNVSKCPVKPTAVSEWVGCCFYTDERCAENKNTGYLPPLPELLPHPGRWEHFHLPLWFFLFISLNSRLFCSSKSPIYSSARVKRRPPPLRVLLSPPPHTHTLRVGFLWRRFSWKEGKSQLVGLIVAAPAWGRVVGFLLELDLIHLHMFRCSTGML